MGGPAFRLDVELRVKNGDGGKSNRHLGPWRNDRQIDPEEIALASDKEGSLVLLFVLLVLLISFVDFNCLGFQNLTAGFEDNIADGKGRVIGEKEFGFLNRNIAGVPVDEFKGHLREILQNQNIDVKGGQLYSMGILVRGVKPEGTIWNAVRPRPECEGQCKSDESHATDLPELPWSPGFPRVSLQFWHEIMFEIDILARCGRYELGFME
jgi:hypothetical protein